MHQNIYKYLSRVLSDQPDTVDRIIVSSYLRFHDMVVENNELLLAHIIQECQQDSAYLEEFFELILLHAVDFSFEDLIELFEFVISPADKTVNGAVYTPAYIREYIVDRLLADTLVELSNLTALDPACGCGGFLLTLSNKLNQLTGRSFLQIYAEQLFGVDITAYSVTRAQLLLALQALNSGEDENFTFNFEVQNSLVFKASDYFPVIVRRNGFDLVMGNPPYVSSRNMDVLTLSQALDWQVSKSGHPDLYIPFFQLAIEQLNAQGILGYITVNTFMKSINGRALRQYFVEQGLDLEIINFGGEQVFNDRNTYTCICFIRNRRPGISYIRTLSTDLDSMAAPVFRRYDYETLNHRSGWNLVNTALLDEFIATVEAVGDRFEDCFDTKNGIATLKNEVYKFKPIHEDRAHYHLISDRGTFLIERGICRSIVNANKVKRTEDLVNIREQVIFPYQRIAGRLVVISEAEMLERFPNAYAYLLTQRVILAKRDKGLRQYETWFAFGRRQSMDDYAFKLFFPHICERPTFVLSDESDLLFYNGIAVVGEDEQQLLVLKKILESDVFFEYIKNTTKDYSSGYLSMSRNYLKNFGVPELTPEQTQTLLTMSDSNEFIEEIYGVQDFMAELRASLR